MSIILNQQEPKTNFYLVFIDYIMNIYKWLHAGPVLYLQLYDLVQVVQWNAWTMAGHI
jgi:hypothetical protein